MNVSAQCFSRRIPGRNVKPSVAAGYVCYLAVFCRSAIGGSPPIVLKNPDFRFDHNCRGR